MSTVVHVSSLGEHTCPHFLRTEDILCQRICRCYVLGIDIDANLQNMTSDTTIVAGARRPAIWHVMNVAGHLVSLTQQPQASLNPDVLIAQAQKQTGLSDFGNDDFREGLEVLTESLRHEARLTGVGKLMAAGMIIRLLDNRLRIEEKYRQHPEIDQQKVCAPIVIAGLPRTGTTVLQHLLAAHPDTRYFTFTEGALPVPQVPDNRTQRVQRELNLICQLAPGFRAIHDMGARLPQECIVLMALNFVSVQFELNFHIPSYTTWYQQQDLTPTMRYHKRVLKFLQYHRQLSGERWVLKTPPYVNAIPEVQSVYPDASIIQTHRDPTEIIASVASLYFALHRVTSSKISREIEGRAQLATWGDRLSRNMTDRSLIEKTARITDVRFHDIVSDPITTVRHLYDQVNLRWDDEIHDITQRALEKIPRNQHGVHRYSPEMYGLDTQAVAARFSAYREFSQITPQQ